MSQVITAAEVEAALRAALPERLHAYIASVARVLADLVNGIVAPSEAEARVANEPHATRLLRNLAGQTIGTAASTISFGADNVLGDVTIGDVAGGGIVRLTINLAPAFHTDQQPGSRERNMPDGPLSLIEDEIRAVLRPLMGDRDSRRGRLARAFGSYPGLLGRINLDVEPGVFLDLLLQTLRDYGDIKRGQPAVCVLLESIKGEVGLHDQQRIKRIIHDYPH